MNRGPRGNATGFKISSLLKLKDTKGENGQTLLHFLAEQVSPHLLNMETNELPSVRSAAGVCLGEIEREVAWMRKHLQDGEEPGFEDAVKRVEEELAQVVQEVDKTLLHFGEEKAEELFSIFGEFLSSWGEVGSELVNRNNATVRIFVFCLINFLNK
jgi:hypothetical protein